MKRHAVSFGILFLCFLMIFVFRPGARADNEPVETLLSSVIRESCPDCRVLDYAPIGPEQTEYIVLAVDSAEKTPVMIVNTEQPSAGVEFRNDTIMERIPLNKDSVRMMDHLADGSPYFEYRKPDGPDFLYIVFHKGEGGKWSVAEAQFGDEWHELYWFRYDPADQKIHISLLGNELTVISDDVINRDAAFFHPETVRLYLRDILNPYIQE